MTEEEARKLFIDIGISAIVGKAMEGAIDHGYIRKSALVELVEEAEKMYDYWCSDKKTNCEVVMDAMKIAISKLKKDHPEFTGGKK